MFAIFADIARLMRAGFVLARHDALLPQEYLALLPAPARLFSRIARLIADPARANNPGARFAKALEELGPAYIKLGQFLATRGDILDQTFVEGLSTLKDKAAPFSMAEAKTTLREEFPDTADHTFHHLSAPIAAASVAQVHKLPQDGTRPLAIKVLRPGVEAAIAKDMKAFALGAKIVEALIPAAKRLKPVAFVQTVSRALTFETDLRLEAASASEMADIAKEIDGFSVPKVDWAKSGKRCLAVSWIDGAPLSDPGRVAALNIDHKALAVTCIRAFLHGALNHGVFHADMHEGNLFVTPKGELIAIDFGLVGRIGPAERRYLAEILYGFITRNYRRIAEVHFEAGYVPDRHNVADFASALRAVGEPIWGKSSDEVSMGRLLLQLFEVTDLFDMSLRPELVLLQKTMVQVEGVARGLDPAFDMWAAAGPVVEDWVGKQLGPRGMAKDLLAEATRLRTSLAKLPDAIDAVIELRANQNSPPPNGAKPKTSPWPWIALTTSAIAALIALWKFVPPTGG